MTKSAATDLVVGLIAMLWAMCAFFGTPQDGLVEQQVWRFGWMLATLCSWKVAAAFGLAALGRSYAAMRGTA